MEQARDPATPLLERLKFLCISARIGEEAHKLVEEQYRVLNEELIPALERERIRFVRRTERNATATSMRASVSEPP